MGKGTAWFLGIMALLLVTGWVASHLTPSEEVRLALVAWQQFLFALGGICGGGVQLLKPVGPKRMVQGALWGVALYLANTLLSALIFALAAQFWGEAARELFLQDRAAVQMLVTSKKPFIAWGSMLMLILGAPLGEELFFRGLMVSLLKERTGAKAAVLLSALLFALLHFYTLQFLPVLVSGIILGHLFVRSGSILVPFAAHCVVNSLALVALLASL